MKKDKKTRGGISYFNVINVPKEGKAVLCLVAQLWPINQIELKKHSNSIIEIPYGFYYLDRLHHSASFEVKLEEWVELIREDLKGKEIIWEPLQNEFIGYEGGHFGRKHYVAEILYFVPFNPKQRKIISSKL